LCKPNKLYETINFIIDFCSEILYIIFTKVHSVCPALSMPESGRLSYTDRKILFYYYYFLIDILYFDNIV
jgi:hypothetical protein